MNFRLTLIFCLFAVSVSVSSKVMVQQVPYSCCHSPVLQFNERCQNTWSVDDKNIAHFAKGKISCVAPCKKIESGQMTLDVCMDVNLTMVCQHHLGMVKEDFLYYQSQPCPRSFANGAPSQSALGLALLTAGWIVKIIQETICFI